MVLFCRTLIINHPVKDRKKRKNGIFFFLFFSISPVSRDGDLITINQTYGTYYLRAHETKIPA